MINYKEISLFKGLNSLRFFAAFLVVMHHSETIRKKNLLPNFEWLGLFRNGGNAVTFFFVLSGFLITYLLLKENNKTQTISIKTFYVKRMLRIWPLYFLLVFIGAVIMPVMFRVMHINYEMPYTIGQAWPYFVFFVPGLVTFFFGHHLLEPLWSIGVEEIFYLIWAPLFKLFKRASILPLLLAVVIVKVILILMSQTLIKDPLFVYVVNSFSFEAMAIGGLGAYYVFNYGASLNGLFIYKKYMQVIIYATLAIYLILFLNPTNIIWNTVFSTPVLSQLLIDGMFLYLIIGVSLIDHNIINIRSKFLSYLGEISYGIYMYHMLIIFAIIQFLKKYLLAMPPVVSSITYYAILTTAVIVVASISKKVFENPFLTLKKKLDKNPEARNPLAEHVN